MAELSKELKDIKKKYGETFMHICRDNFASLLETEGLLTQVLDRYFAANSKSIGDDIINSGKIIELKDFIYSKVDVEKEEKQIIEDKTPYEILDEAGYKLIECTSEEEIQEFRKYYAPDEVICTIYNGGRLDTSEVFFAVKKDVENIKRADFEKPQREDEYGTSVLGIQFDKYGTCLPHIITRYNHTVNNPNATYGNDLDRIAPGLTESFARLLHERGLELNNTNIEDLELPGYTVASDGKYYKYNMEVNGKYYCPGNIIIDGGKVIKFNPDKEVLMDYFILDKQKKTLTLFDTTLQDSFLDSFENIENIKMEGNPDKEKQTRLITIKIKDSNSPIIIEIDKDNNIVGYNNQELAQVGNNFLRDNRMLSKLNIPRLTQVGNNFLRYNRMLSKLNISRLTEVGNNFLCYNRMLSKLNIPRLAEVGDNFLHSNELLRELNLPQLTEVGKRFLFCNEQIREINLPNLTKVGNNFLYFNKKLSELNLPQLTEVGDDFLNYNKQIREINLPQLIEAGSGFLHSNKELKTIDLPKLLKVGGGFLTRNKQISEINLPQLIEADFGFLESNIKLKTIDLPKLLKVGEGFLLENEQISELNLPQLIEAGGSFLMKNKQISEINLPQLTKVAYRFLYSNRKLSKLYLPKLKEKGNLFLGSHPRKEELIANMHKKVEEKKADITPEQIARLDRDTELTTTEVSLGKELIDKNLSNEKGTIQK